MKKVLSIVVIHTLKPLLKREIDVHIAIYKSTSKNLYDEMSC